MTKSQLACSGLAILIVLLTACAAGHKQEVQALNLTGSKLDSPSELPLALPTIEVLSARPRAASFSAGDILRTGSSFEGALTNGRVTAVGLAADFAPEHSPGDSGTSGTAFAMYGFGVEAYDREPQLHLDWDTDPTTGNLFVGLANFSSQRWDWFRPENAVLDFGVIAPYVSPNDLLFAAILLTGTDSATLSRLRLGDAYPEAALTADLQSGETPLLVTFNAEGSTTPEGTLTLFEWDFDGDGVYEEDSAAVPVKVHTYEEPGTFNAVVRVSNDSGHNDTATVAIDLVNEFPWLHTLGTADYNVYRSAAVDVLGNVYTTGENQNNVNQRDLVVSKWSPTGAQLWSKLWKFGDCESEGLDVAVDSAGNLIVAGWNNDFGPGIDDDAVLLKLDPEGNLLWARNYAAVEDERFTTVCTVGEEIYVSGNAASIGTDQDMLVLQIDATGTAVWIRRYRWFWENVVDSELLITSEGAQSLYILSAEEKRTSPTREFPMWVNYGLNGDFLADGQSTDTQEMIVEGLALSYEPGLDTTTIYVTGWESVAPFDGFMLMATNTDYASLFTKFMEGSDHTEGLCIDFEPLAGLLVGGHFGFDAAIWRFAAADGTLVGGQVFFSDNNYSQCNSIEWLEGRVLCAGYADSTAAEWQPMLEAPQNISRAWGFAAGLSSMENIALADPLDDVVIDWSGTVLDSGGGSSDGLLSVRSVP